MAAKAKSTPRAKSATALKAACEAKLTAAGLDLGTIQKIIAWASNYGPQVYIALIALFDVFASPQPAQATGPAAGMKAMVKAHADCCEELGVCLDDQLRDLMSAVNHNCHLHCCLLDEEPVEAGAAKAPAAPASPPAKAPPAPKTP